MVLTRKFMATAIGSFPYDDAGKALDIIFNALPESPVWPQLPRRALTEKMEIQYSEGIPRVVIDGDKERMYFDTTGDYSEDFGSFYEFYLGIAESDDPNADFSRIAISPGYSRGIYALEERLQKGGKKYPYVKVHTTGPCSFSLSTVDENKRALYYNEEFRDVIVKAMALKCRWQIRKFAPYAEQVICFIDEPILSAFGSSTYVSVKREDVVAMIAEVVEAVHADGGVAGVHCCGNTDWSILVDAGVDLLNFDAYGYGETIALYPEQIKRHIQGGGALAWGIVPTSELIRNETVDSLVARYEKLVEHLAAKTGLDRNALFNATVLTPSCGTGSLDPADAEKVFAALRGVSESLRKKYA